MAREHEVDFIETHVRRVLEIQAKYKPDYLKRSEYFLAFYGLNPDHKERYAKLSYGSLTVFYPYDEEPAAKFDDVEVIYDGLTISHWSQEHESVSLHVEEFEKEEYWNLADVDRAVRMFSDFLTDYIELVFEEKATDEAWLVEDSDGN